MPRKEIDYSKIVIYKIVCNDLNITDVYVGSTTDFTKRKSSHKSYCNNENCKSYNLKIYKMIRDNGGWDNWTMLEIEKYSCNDGNESRLRERYHLELLNAKLNCQLPSRPKKEQNKEWYEKNKDKEQLRIKEYYKQNKDKINERKRELRKLKKEQSV